MMLEFNGKMKAITFSYDDGVMQDKRLVDLFNKYGLKATFNLNSERFGQEAYLVREGVKVEHFKVNANEVKMLYSGHEIAAHTLTHPNLCKLDTEEIIRQVEQDRINLSNIVGYDVCGMAYPGGGTNHDDRVVSVIREHTQVRYARTIECTYNFEPQSQLYEFKPTVYHMEFDKMFELGEAFIKAQPDSPQIFYIWGHSYEFDIKNTWDKFETFCKMMSGHDDIFYGTNREILGL